MGNVLSAGIGQAPARQSALKAGLPNSIPAVTINKVCGSGLKAVMLASQAIRCGEANAIIAGGMENMSAAPHIANGLRTGIKLGDIHLIDSMVLNGLTCSFESCHMGVLAENLAKRFQVTRSDQDEFALTSQRRATAAIAAGWFVKEIVPVTVPHRDGNPIIDTDEGPRPDSTLAGLSQLRPVFDRDGSITAGNASSLSDGAAAVLVTDEATAANAPWKFKILASHSSGTDPKDLFLAPVLAVNGALKKANLKSNDIDLFEINEAFASQMVVCLRELKLDPAQVNISGGGISLGHPIGASGARLLVTLIHALRRTNQKRGVVSLCIGGGNAVAMVIEAA
jgi:acetyl-CoA C-acetyltransferase